MADHLSVWRERVPDARVILSAIQQTRDAKRGAVTFAITTLCLASRDPSAWLFPAASEKQNVD